MPRAPRTGDWLTLLVLTVFWGSAFMFNAIALESFSPSMLVALRIVIAAAILVVYMRASGIRFPEPGRRWLPMLVMAVLGNVLPFQLVAWAQQHIPSSLAGVLMAVMPLFVLTLAHFFVPGSRLTPLRVAGFGMGFVGVVFVIGPDALRGGGGNLALWGAIAALGAALSYSVSTIYARRLGAVDPVSLSAGMLLVGSLLTVPVAALDVPALAAPTPGAVLAVLVLGVLCTGIATLMYFRLVQGPGPAFLSFVNYLVPAWAVVAGALFLDEALSSWAYAGLVLILSGIALSEAGPGFTRLRRWLDRRGAQRVAKERA
jgi:drug/metabolite transporter (DMT)-like permease